MTTRPTFYRPAALAFAALLAAACSSTGKETSRVEAARYLYVWAGSGNDTTAGLDVVTVLDANPTSPNYGNVLAALTVDSAGRMPHHTEFALPQGGTFFANDYSGDKSFLLDYSHQQLLLRILHADRH